MGLKENPFTAKEHDLFPEVKVKLQRGTICGKSLIFHFLSNPTLLLFSNPCFWAKISIDYLHFFMLPSTVWGMLHIKISIMMKLIVD